MIFTFPQGGANATIYAWLFQDNAGTEPGEPQTGLTSSSTGMGLAYLRPRGTVQTVALSALSTVDAAHTDGGMIEIDATNMPGLYRFDLPDAAIARGENYVVVMIKQDDIVAKRKIVLLDPMPSVIQGAVNDVSATTTSFVTDLAETTNDQFVDAFVLFVDGANAGAVEKCTGYNGSTKALTTDAFPTAPGDTDSFIIVNR